MKSPPPAKQPSRLLGAALLVVSVAVGLVVMRPALPTSAHTALRTGGAPRRVNSDRLEQLISDRQLSDREALYYRSLPEDGEVP